LFRREKPDIIHLNSAKIGGIGALAGRIARVPKIIFTAHGWTFNESRPPFIRFIIRCLSWLTIVLSHTVIVLSEREKRQVVSMPFTRNKVVVVRNGVDAIEQADKIEVRKKLESLSQLKNIENNIFIGTISELHQNKGLRYAIQAFASLVPSYPSLVFIIIGEGEERPALEAMIEKHNLKEKVILLGHIAHAAHLLPGLDIFLLSSLKEGLPYAILEAGNASLPVVATSVGSIPEIIDNAVSGLLVNPKNSEEIETAIRFLLENPAKRQEYGAALYKTITSRFTKDTMIEQTIGLYMI